MGSGNKKKKGEIDMGKYTGSIREQAAYSWCINNGIYISPWAKSTSEWYICISINGKTNMSPDAYGPIVIWQQLYKFYVYYYNKYSGAGEGPVEEVIKKPKQRVKSSYKDETNKLF
jgi:hypothetical protein